MASRLAVAPLALRDTLAIARYIARDNPDAAVSFITALETTGHALAEMRKDKLSTVDCTSVLRGGVVEPGELERGSWRYRVKTNTICVVMAFRSETELVVVTAWRIGR